MTVQIAKEENQITKGEIRYFLSLFFPALLISFSSYFALFVEKIFLGRFSTEAMEISISANYACMIFQAPCTALAMMAQVFIGRWYGAQEHQKIGAGLWQFIWFSLLSLFIVVLLGILYGKSYFQGTPIEQHGAFPISILYFLLIFSFR